MCPCSDRDEMVKRADFYARTALAGALRHPGITTEERYRAALERIAGYDIKVTNGAADAYAIQDIAREAVSREQQT